MKRTLELVQSTTFSLVVTARDATGAVVDLTGLTGTAIVFKLARELGQTTADLSLSIGSGITLDASPTTGKFTIAITGAQLADLDAGWYFHECRVTKAGITYRPLYGNARLTEDIP